METNSRILTKQAASLLLQEKGFVTTISCFDPSCKEDEPYRSFYLFTNDHCFSLQGGKDLGFNKSWVPSTTYMPLRVVPRASVPSGMVFTLDEYIAIFHSNDIFIESVDQLISVIQLTTKE